MSSGPWPPVLRYPQYPHEVAKVPAEEHFAILVNESHYCSDDGYGGSSHSPYLSYLVFQNIEQVQGWIRQNNESSSRKAFRVLQVKPCNVTLEIKVHIE